MTDVIDFGKHEAYPIV